MADPSNVDPNTLVGAGLLALASKDMLGRLLGPTADYIGGEIKGLAEKCNVNLGRIFGHAVKKVGLKIDQPGAVSPRVLKQVWSEGAFIEDELAAEYFGGLLASARTSDGKDDRVLALLSAVRDLSVYDLRLHYLIYSLVRAKCLGSGYSLQQANDADISARILFSTCPASIGMEGDEGTVEELSIRSLHMLDRYDLVGPYHIPTIPPMECLPGRAAIYHSGSERGMWVGASYFGTLLFLWAHGHSDKRIDQIFDSSLDFSSPVGETIMRKANLS